MCNFKTIGHHTFEDRGKNDEKYAPYRCKHVNAFLGSGFYYWEDNLQFAKHWGGEKYKTKGKEYYVSETNFECDRGIFFDLVGVRAHQKFLVEASKILSQLRPSTSNWPIGKLIEMLRGSNIDEDSPFYNRFNFNVIRAADDFNSRFGKNAQFAENQPNLADLNPCYIICVTDLNKIILNQVLRAHASRPTN